MVKSGDFETMNFKNDTFLPPFGFELTVSVP